MKRKSRKDLCYVSGYDKCGNMRFFQSNNDLLHFCSLKKNKKKYA